MSDYYKTMASDKLRKSLYGQIAASIIALYRTCYKFDEDATNFLDEVLPILDRYNIVDYDGKDPDDNVLDFQTYKERKNILEPKD